LVYHGKAVHSQQEEAFMLIPSLFFITALIISVYFVSSTLYLFCAIFFVFYGGLFFVKSIRHAQKAEMAECYMSGAIFLMLFVVAMFSSRAGFILTLEYFGMYFDRDTVSVFSHILISVLFVTTIHQRWDKYPLFPPVLNFKKKTS
jgi:lysylphosphatidylglycerol synthetase-like protein (DUF2156 family)